MSISGIAPPVVPGGNGGAGARKQNQQSALDGLNYNAFLKLLVTQLQHQDPTRPMDSTAYLAQLASYANVEQNIRTNARLDAVMAAVQAEHASSLLGRSVATEDGTLGGVVQGYEMRETQVVLLLDNGERLPLEAGVKVIAQDVA